MHSQLVAPVFMILAFINSVICGPVRTDRENQRSLLYAPAPPPPPPPPTLPPIDFWDLPGFLPNEYGESTGSRRSEMMESSFDPSTPHFSAISNTTFESTGSRKSEMVESSFDPSTPQIPAISNTTFLPPPRPPPTLPPLDLYDLPGFPPTDLEVPDNMEESTATRQSEMMGRSFDPSSPQFPALSSATFNDWMKVMGPFVYWSTMAAINSVLQNMPQLQKDVVKIEPNVNWNLNHDVEQTTIEKVGDILGMNNRFNQQGEDEIMESEITEVSDKVTEHKELDEHKERNEHEEQRVTTTDIEEPLESVGLNFENQKQDTEQGKKDERNEFEEQSHEKENKKGEHDQDDKHKKSDSDTNVQKLEQGEKDKPENEHIETEKSEPYQEKHKEHIQHEERNVDEQNESDPDVHKLKQSEPAEHQIDEHEPSEKTDKGKYKGQEEHNVDEKMESVAEVYKLEKVEMEDLEMGVHKTSVHEKTEYKKNYISENGLDDHKLVGSDEHGQIEPLTYVHKHEQNIREAHQTGELESEKRESSQDEHKVQEEPNAQRQSEPDTDAHKLVQREKENHEKSEHETSEQGEHEKKTK